METNDSDNRGTMNWKIRASEDRIWRKAGRSCGKHGKGKRKVKNGQR